MSKKFTYLLLMLSSLVTGSSLMAQNTALSFSSTTSDYATTNASTYPIPQGNPGTIEMWVYVPTAQAGLHEFISQGPNTGSVAFYLGYDGSTNKFLMGDIGGETTNATITYGQWNHIALTVDASFNARFFLNGVQTDSLMGSFFVTAGGTQMQLGTSTDTTIFFTGEMDQVRIWNYDRTAAQVKNGMYHPVDSASTGLIADYLFDATPGVTHNSGTTANIDLTLAGSTTTANSPVQSANNALTFSQPDTTQVNVAANSAYDFSSGTIEAWLQPGTLTGNAAYVASRGAGGSRYSLHITNTFGNNLVGMYNDTYGFTHVSYAPGFTSGTWYHVALVVAPAASGDTTAVYVNGAYIGQIPNGFATGITGQPLTIGGNGLNANEMWQGGIDEVRLWNVALTQTQIINNMGNTLTGNESGLVGLWSFDQGISNGDNTGLKVAVDNAPLTNNGNLSKFALTAASASNYTVHTLVPLPVNLTLFTVSKQSNNTALLQWQTAQEQNSRDFIIERSGNGSTYTDIGSVAAAGTSHVKTNYSFTDDNPIEGKNYYRLRETDLDGKSMYSPVRVLAFTKAGNLVWYSTGSKSAEVRLQNGSNELYTIADMAGHTLRTGRLSSGVTTLSQLPGGVYFVKVTTNAGDELVTKVVVK
jgi:hypothetical protein